jgi:uncharacterized membrane protein YdfJ with MMPL/SSD domain
MHNPASRAPGLTGGLGRACYRHRWLVLGAWIVGVACLITLWMQFGAPADNNFTGTDAGQALLNRHFPRQSGDALTLAIRSAAPVTSSAVRGRVSGALGPFRAAPQVTSVVSPYAAAGHVSADGHIAFATVQFGVPAAQIPNSEVLALMNDARAASGRGVTFSLGGDVVDLAESPYGGPTDGFGVTAAIIVLLIAFGSLLAMALPLASAIFGIGSGLSLIALLGHQFPAPSFSPIIASMIGLGVGIDYALFIVTRFRGALRDGADPPDAAVTAMRTAGRSVLVAGSTVVIGMLGLLVLRQQLLNGVAIAAAATVAMTVLASLTLLPALLGFTGDRLGRPSWLRPHWPGRRRAHEVAGPAPARRHPAERWAAVIQRRPAVAAIAAVAFVLVLAAPALRIQLNGPDESTQGRATMGYASYAAMARGFGPGFDAPLIVTARLPSPGARLTPIVAALRATPGVARVTPPVVSRDGQAALLIAYPTTGEQDQATNALVNRVNARVLPRATAGTGIKVYLTGPNAANVAFTNLIQARLLWLIGIVVGVAMLILLMVFRSVVVAVKAAVMNLLSVAAAYGVLTAVVQWGWGRQLFGFPEKMPVTTWVPVFLFVILFGLSMDYEVFLISRIREDYIRTGDNSGAVARGLASTARVITAAAAIMVVVFLSVTLGDNVSVKQIGLGLAVAVLIDASVVRLVLVPAAMELLGRANWWLPGPLARLLPSIAADEGDGPGAPAAAPHPEASPAAAPGT